MKLEELRQARKAKKHIKGARSGEAGFCTGFWVSARAQSESTVHARGRIKVALGDNYLGASGVPLPNRLEGAHVLCSAGKKGLAEVAIVRRIHFIFERAGRKFRSDLSLWLRWIEVCKRYKSIKQLSKVC